MLILIKPEHNSVFASQIASMYRLRHRVFKERLGWNVDVHDGIEKDQFDAASPAYLVRLDAVDAVTACVRLLPTTGPYMLRDTFANLASGRLLPNSPLVWESSRFAIQPAGSTEMATNGLSNATFELFAAMIEFGLARDLSEIVTVTDLRVERILRRAGWPLRRLGEPSTIDTTRAVAGSLEISLEALQRVRETSGITMPVLWEPAWKACDKGL